MWTAVGVAVHTRLQTAVGNMTQAPHKSSAESVTTARRPPSAAHRQDTLWPDILCGGKVQA